MSKKFNELVTEALEAEREYRVLASGRLSLRAFIAECLARAGASYEAVEAVKERLADPLWERHSGCGAYLRDVRREIAAGKFKEPPAKERIGMMGFNQKGEAVQELGGQVPRLFLLWAIAAERAAEVTAERGVEVFGTVEDLPAHKARIAELEARRKELLPRIGVGWEMTDIWLGKITSDGAALVCYGLAPGEVPVHPPATAGERLVDYLLRQEQACRAF
ncbi:MAG: hypothetical protein ACREXK_06300 [Gammaproteobacteria bacterium]